MPTTAKKTIRARPRHRPRGESVTDAQRRRASEDRKDYADAVAAMEEADEKGCKPLDALVKDLGL